MFVDRSDNLFILLLRLAGEFEAIEERKAQLTGVAPPDRVFGAIQTVNVPHTPLAPVLGPIIPPSTSGAYFTSTPMTPQQMRVYAGSEKKVVPLPFEDPAMNAA